MHPLQTIAIRAARAAADTILKAADNPARFNTQAKGRNDFVTDVDLRAEQAIIETIKKTYPEHAILAEESGQESTPDAEVTWVIDPIDGTTNFVRGIGHFAVSIAAQIKGKVEVGVVYDPVRDELFTAAKGGGAQLNSKRIRVSGTNQLSSALLATGFPFRDMALLPHYLTQFEALYKSCSDMRRAGSAALDLAYVAAGRIDGFWEYGLKWWDIAAGTLLVTEAGGMVSDLKGNPSIDTATSLLAANPKIFKAMLQQLP